jgi:hypothetical protein
VWPSDVLGHTGGSPVADAAGSRRGSESRCDEGKCFGREMSEPWWADGIGKRDRQRCDTVNDGPDGAGDELHVTRPKPTLVDWSPKRDLRS